MHIAYIVYSFFEASLKSNEQKQISIRRPALSNTSTGLSETVSVQVA